jgi:hypothetical protein
VSLNHIKWQGFKQGRLESQGKSPVKPCPYAQWPLRHLLRYQAWVNGWAKGRGF